MEKRSQGANKCFIFFFSNDSKVRPGNTSLPTATKISLVHLSLSASGVLVAHREMFYQDVEEEDSEGEGETKYQPDINQLDVRCGGQLVRDGHVESVESVHDKHGRDGHEDGNFFLPRPGKSDLFRLH